MRILRLVSLAQRDRLRLKIARKLSNLIKHPLFAGSAVMVFGSNAVNFLNYLYHLIIGRLLGPSSYGELASLISLMGLLGILPGSITTVIIKFVSSAKEDKETSKLISWLRVKILQLSFVFFLSIILISPFTAAFLHISNKIYFYLIAISFLFSLQSGLLKSILQGLLKFKETVISTLGETGSKLILSVSLIFLGLHLFGAMIGIVVSAVLGWIITTHYLKFKKNKKIEKPANIKSMFIFTFPVVIYSLAITSLYSSDLLLVKHFFSSHDAGIYASLSTLGKIIFFGTGPIASVMFPLVSKRQAKGENYRKIFIYSFLATALLALFILFIYWQAPQFAIYLLYGKAYLEGSNLLVWFGIFITLFTLASLIISYGLSLGRTAVVIFPFFAAIFQIILIWLFHQNLFEVILVSVVVTGLLLISLLIYSSYGDRVSFSYRPNVQTGKNNS